MNFSAPPSSYVIAAAARDKTISYVAVEGRAPASYFKRTSFFSLLY